MGKILEKKHEYFWPKKMSFVLSSAILLKHIAFYKLQVVDEE